VVSISLNGGGGGGGGLRSAIEICKMQQNILLQLFGWAGLYIGSIYSSDLFMGYCYCNMQLFVHILCT